MTTMSALDFQTALFLAALPYRQEFFVRGGWQQAPLPGKSEFQLFLNENFSRIELAAAHSRVQKIMAHPPSSYGPPLYPAKQGHISWWDADYPLALRSIFDPPPILFYALYGNRFPEKDSIFEAVVGTRRPHQICQKAVLARLIELKKKAANPLWIISGFARGVDRLAHKTALELGLGSIAVLGSGLAHAGPRSNLDLLQIAEQTQSPLLLLTEYFPNQTGSRWSFPRRNRIIAGLSWRTTIIQAPRKSGAMITVHHALDAGREVAAFDHELLASPGANEGARSLIENGAELICLPLEMQNCSFIRNSWEVSEQLKLYWQENLFFSETSSLLKGKNTPLQNLTHKIS